MNSFNRVACAASGIALALSPGFSLAQPMLEEVLVTATKRAVGLQDVPIALSVVQGEKIFEQGISDLEDLAVLMPNVHIAEAGGGDQLFIRGVGSGANFGFEQSVGTFIDGVYFGRGQASRGSFLDVERVEVLKGPQSTLFGKNTIAGAINISTAGPSDEFEGFVEGSLEPEFNGWSTTAMVSGPLGDNFGARLVIKRQETDGYMNNRFLNQDERQEEDTVGRVVLEWRPTDTLGVRFKYEMGESEWVGRQNVISVATDLATARYREADPDFVANFGYDKSAANIGAPRPDDDRHNSEWDISTLTVDWTLGEHSLRSITGYVNYDFDNYLDIDYSPLAFLGRGRAEAHEQFTQEFILSSPLGGAIEYLAGLYYQDEDLEHTRVTDARLSSIGIGNGNLDASSLGTFQQDAETWSGFVQLTWNLSDSLRVIGGLRYSDDTKEFTKSQVTTDIFTATANNSLGGLYDQVLNFTTDHTFDSQGATVCKTVAYICTIDPNFDNELEETHWTGDVTVQWDATDELMAYAKVGNGYKAGGFDEDNARGLIPQAEYKDETVKSVELGAKMDVWQGRARINAAVFYSEFDDVQVSTFDGNAGFVVGNAAETETSGFELDGIFAVSESLTLSAALAYLDAEYVSFENAGCNEPQSLAWVAAGGSAGSCVQDLSGKPLQFAPEWSGNLSADYFVTLSGQLELKLGLDATYSDEFIVPNDQDGVLNQDSFWKLNARIQLGAADGRWIIAVVGKNLGDEETSVWGNDVPLASQGFSQTYFQQLDAPRSYEVQARYRF